MGGAKYLFHNLGNGHFEEIQREGRNRQPPLVVWPQAQSIYAGTGHPDLFVANDYGVAELYLNDGKALSTNQASATGVGFAPKSGMNVAAGDIFKPGQVCGVCLEYLGRTAC